MQRFMVIRAIRPDRLIQASRSFIIQGLGRRYENLILFKMEMHYGLYATQYERVIEGDFTPSFLSLG